MVSVQINGKRYFKSDITPSLVIDGADSSFISFLVEWFNDADFILAHTSGSTGSPKIIRLKKSAMIESAKRTNKFFGLKENDSVLMCLSADYIAGKMMIVRAIVGGLNLFVQKASSLPFVDRCYDIASFVPLQIRSFMNDINGVENLSKVKNILVGGSPLQNDEISWLNNLTSDTFVSFGMTETVSHVALSNLKQFNNDSLLYNSLPDVHFKVDERDCLIIYADFLSDKPFITNDVVRLISEDSFVWLGRYDNVINTGGVKVFPEQIEKKIDALIHVPFYISSEKNARFGQQVVLYIESNDEIINIVDDLKNVLSRYEFPKKIYYLKEFERTESGKIKRR